MIRRIYLILMLAAFPAILTGCPSEDQSLGDDIEEGAEEVQDEVDDAL